jgi:hypothetical protein
MAASNLSSLLESDEPISLELDDSPLSFNPDQEQEQGGEDVTGGFKPFQYEQENPLNNFQAQNTSQRWGNSRATRIQDVHDYLDGIMEKKTVGDIPQYDSLRHITGYKSPQGGSLSTGSNAMSKQDWNAFFNPREEKPGSFAEDRFAINSAGGFANHYDQQQPASPSVGGTSIANFGKSGETIY